jgi:hypothetical protein
MFTADSRSLQRVLCNLDVTIANEAAESAAFFRLGIANCTVTQGGGRHYCTEIP